MTNTKSTIFTATLLIGFIGGSISGGLVGYIAASTVIVDNENQVIEENKEEIVQDNDLIRSVVEESATTKVVENAKPSVVSIVISKELQTQQGNGRGINGFGNFNGPFFDDFFFEDGGSNQSVPDDGAETQTVEIGGGTGFIITKDGLILTNKHVVSDQNADYTVVLDNGESHDAEVVARDTLTDIAILQIKAENLTPLELGNADKLAQGQTVIAIGNTLGEYSNTVTKGVISGLSRDLGAGYSGLIQTDAAINQGNSGGPLLNLDGQVIGVNTAVDRSGEGIGFAITINEAKVAIDSVKEHGRIVRAGLGVRYILIDKEIADLNNLPYERGAYIRGSSEQEFGVLVDSAADKAGIQEGDIILEIDGEQVDDDNPLADLIKNYKVGDTIDVLIYRDETETVYEVTLEELDGPKESFEADVEE